jgi:hypothetical protein
MKEADKKIATGNKAETPKAYEWQKDEKRFEGEGQAQKHASDAKYQ